MKTRMLLVTLVEMQTRIAQMHFEMSEMAIIQLEKIYLNIPFGSLHQRDS